MIAGDGDKHPVPTVDGCTLQESYEGEKIKPEDEIGGMALVTIVNVVQSNGVVNVIDAVLLPKQSAELLRKRTPFRPPTGPKRGAIVLNPRRQSMKRRMFLLSGSAALLTRPAFATESSSEITRTEVEWRAMLNEVEYPVMHEEET